MKIAFWQRESFINYESKISTLVFTPKCNYQCPTCHAKKIIKNKEQISEEEIFSYLDSRKEWIEGVVLCGGEPTLEFGLKHFLIKLKEKGLLVKLDTNGSNYSILRELKEENLVDYVAMDVKGPLNLYAKIVGRDFIDERDDLGKGISLTSQFSNYEFRTTVVPLFENEKPRWLSPEEIRETAKLIYNWTRTKEHKYFLQKFVSRNKDEMLDEKFAKEKLPKAFHETPSFHLEECLLEAKKYLPNTCIR